jgi:hypothetical protein
MFPRAVKQGEIPAYRLFTLDADSVKSQEVSHQPSTASRRGLGSAPGSSMDVLNSHKSCNHLSHDTSCAFEQTQVLL